MEITDFDQDESAEAWDAACRILRDHPLAQWISLPFPIPPELVGNDKFLKEAYFFSALYAASTLEITVGLNGLEIVFPGLFGAEEAKRSISFETLLPFIDRAVSEREARWLADRFRGLAAICERKADETKKG